MRCNLISFNFNLLTFNKLIMEKKKIVYIHGFGGSPFTQTVALCNIMLAEAMEPPRSSLLCRICLSSRNINSLLAIMSRVTIVSTTNF